MDVLMSAEPRRARADEAECPGAHDVREGLAKDLSQEALGNLVDLNYNHIGRYERGESRPSAHKLRAMPDALRVTTDYLLGGSEDNSLKADINDVDGGTPHKDVAVSRRPWMFERDQVSRVPWMPNKDVLAALAPPALRSIRASLPKNAAGDMEVGRRRGEIRRARSDGPGAAGYEKEIREGFPGCLSVPRESKRGYCVDRG